MDVFTYVKLALY